MATPNLQKSIEELLEIQSTILINSEKCSQLMAQVFHIMPNLDLLSQNQIVELSELFGELSEFLGAFTKNDLILKSWRTNSHQERFHNIKNKLKLYTEDLVSRIAETDYLDEKSWENACSSDIEQLHQFLASLLSEQGHSETDITTMLSELVEFESRLIAENKTTEVLVENNDQTFDTLQSLRSGHNVALKPILIDLSEVQYNELNFLGRGSFGAVYKCSYQQRDCAIKVVIDLGPENSNIASDLRREALTMQLVTHPNIITYYGAHLEAPKRFIVMELAECSLFDVLHDPEKPQFYNLFGSDLTLQMKTALLSDCLNALVYLHSVGVVHRDIKSHNILVSLFSSGNYVLKITDFGLAKMKHATSGSRSSTGGAKGTPAYMAPEILLADTPTDSVYSQASDVYAFSIMMNEILTRSIPFSGFSTNQIFMKIHRDQRPDLFGISLNAQQCKEFGIVMEYQQLINKCWDVDISIRLTFNKLLRNVGFVLSALGGDPRHYRDEVQSAMVIEHFETQSATTYFEHLPRPPLVRPLQTELVTSPLFYGNNKGSSPSPSPVMRSDTTLVKPMKIESKIPPKTQAVTSEVIVLQNLSISDVSVLLKTIHMTDLMPAFTENNVSGAILYSCDELSDLKELGITKNIQAKTLLRLINEWKQSGLTAEIMSNILEKRSKSSIELHPSESTIVVEESVMSVTKVPSNAEFLIQEFSLMRTEVAVMNLWRDVYEANNSEELLRYEPLVVAMIDSVFNLCDKPDSLVSFGQDPEFVGSFLSLLLVPHTSHTEADGDTGIDFSPSTIAKGLRTISHLCRHDTTDKSHIKKNVKTLLDSGAIFIVFSRTVRAFRNEFVHDVRWGFEALANLVYDPTILMFDDIMQIMIDEKHINALCKAIGSAATTNDFSEPGDVNIARAGIRILANLSEHSDEVSQMLFCDDLITLISVLSTCFPHDFEVLRNICLLLKNITILRNATFEVYTHQLFTDSFKNEEVSFNDEPSIFYTCLSILLPMIVETNDLDMFENFSKVVNFLSMMDIHVALLHSTGVYQTLAVLAERFYKRKQFPQSPFGTHVRNLLHVGIKMDCIALVDVIVRKGYLSYIMCPPPYRISLLNLDGSSPLVHATRLNNIAIVKLLLEKGFNDVGCLYGDTALKIAYTLGCKELVDLLLTELGHSTRLREDINLDQSITDNGETLFLRSCQTGDASTLTKLLNAGAHFNIPNKLGINVKECCSVHAELDQLLSQQSFYRSNGGLLVINPFTSDVLLNKCPEEKDNQWVLSVYFASDHIQSLPNNVFVLCENYDAKLDIYSLRKYHLVNGTMQVDSYTKQFHEIEKEFRELIFGPMHYTECLKPRYYAHSIQLNDVALKDIENRLLSSNIKLFSDFCGILRYSVFNNMFLDVNWKLLCQLKHELTPYDLLLFDSPEELGRIRSNSVDVETQMIDEILDNDNENSLMNTTNFDRFESSFRRYDDNMMSLLLFFKFNRFTELYDRNGYNVMMYSSSLTNCKLLQVALDTFSDCCQFFLCPSLHRITHQIVRYIPGIIHHHHNIFIVYYVQEGETPLHVAASNNNSMAVSCFIDAIYRSHRSGTNINWITDQRGYTPLHTAVINGNLAVTKQLCDFGRINLINITTHMGYTALSLSATHNQLKAMRYLLQSKADVNIPDNFGRYTMTFIERERNFPMFCAFVQQSKQFDPNVGLAMLPSYGEQSEVRMIIEALPGFVEFKLAVKAFIDSVIVSNSRFQEFQMESCVRHFRGTDLQLLKTAASLYGKLLKEMEFLINDDVVYIDAAELLKMNWSEIEILNSLEGGVVAICIDDNTQDYRLFDLNMIIRDVIRNLIFADNAVIILSQTARCDGTIETDQLALKKCENIWCYTRVPIKN